MLIMLRSLSQLIIILLPPWGGPLRSPGQEKVPSLGAARTALGRQRLNHERPE